MGHFLRLLVTRRWGWTLIAALIIVGGVLWGVSSPTIPYQNSLTSPVGTTVYYVGAADNGDIYLWTTDKTNPTFYVARHEDFNPPIDRTKIHLDNRVSFVSRSDTIFVNEKLDDNIHISQAHIVESLTLYDTGTHIVASYNASGYTAGSSGYFDNRWWPGGSATIFVGLLVGFLALSVRRKKRGQRQEADQSTPGWPFVNIPAYPATEPAPNSPDQNTPNP